MKYKIGTKEKPMLLKTPPLTSEYTMHVDEKDRKEYGIHWPLIDEDLSIDSLLKVES